MTFPLEGIMSYKARKENLEDAMNTRVAGCCLGQEKTLARGEGDWEREENLYGDRFYGNAIVDVSVEIEGVKDAG